MIGTMITVVMLAACSSAPHSSPRSVGSVMGIVAPCFASAVQTTVFVYAGQHVVATGRTHEGTIFRFSLPVGKYSVRDASGSYPVVVSKGGIARVPEQICN
jgi:hypothetical protein